MVGTRSLSSGARSRDPVALPPYVLRNIFRTAPTRMIVVQKTQSRFKIFLGRFPTANLSRSSQNKSK
jgi:hypothetical protein